MMDAGLLDTIQHDNNFQLKADDAAPQGDVKSQEVQDDGYETSNGADPQQQQAATASSSSSSSATGEKQSSTNSKTNSNKHRDKTPESTGSDLETRPSKSSKPSSPSDETVADMEGEAKQQPEGGKEDPDIVQKDKNMMNDGDEDEEMKNLSNLNSEDVDKSSPKSLDRLGVVAGTVGREDDDDNNDSNEDEDDNEGKNIVPTKADGGKVVSNSNSRSNSNSPKRLLLSNNSNVSNSRVSNEQLNNDEDDSNASIRDQLVTAGSPNNSRSNSSSLDSQQRRQQQSNLQSAFNNNNESGADNLDAAATEPNINPSLTHEDSSSQSQGYPVNAATQMEQQQMNPYDMKRLQQPSYMPMTSFGGIKREPYDMSTGGSGSDQQQHNDPYGHFVKRQDDPYSRENVDPYNRNQYKRPDEMFMGSYNKDDMNSYGGFSSGIKRDSMNPYYNSGQFVGGIKRDHDDLMSYNGIKRECSEDPYSFVDEDAAVCAMLSQQGGMGGPGGGPMHPDLMQQHLMQNAPKKRGRKKKIKDECDIKQEPGPDGMIPLVKPIKERKKHDRFNGMPEEEVCRRTLPDHLAENLDIIIIGINPGLFAAYKGHHYAGPGNHFWKCLYLSGLTQEQMSADEDYKLLHFGIGFTNMVSRATKGSADLTRKEIKEGSQILLEKLQTFRPKIAVFNGKLIYEVFSGKKDFNFGRQPDTVHGTNTYMWVMPSSSARCAQLPRAADKVPFYSALRRFRDYLNGTLAHVDEAELVFPDTTCRREREENEIRRLLGPDTPCETMVLEDGTEVPVKKKRGRPKKIKLENGEVAPSAPRPPRPPRPPQPVELGPNGELPPKKKRGRPKKVRPEDQAFMAQQQQQQQPNNSLVTPLPNMPLSSQLNMSNPQSMDSGNYAQSLMGSGRDYSQQGLNMDTSSPMMYGNTMGQNNMSGGGPIQGQNLAVNVPQTSPYFSQGLSSGNQDSGDIMPGTPGAMGMRNQPGFGQSPGPFSQSPRSQGVGYGSSPRPAGYSQSPQRHQMATGSYSNSPAHQQQSTALPFSQSPVPQGAHYSQSPPLRPHSQNHNYSQQSPVPGHSYSRSPVPQNNTPTYSQQSPMFAQSPANMPHPYSQSPVPQSQRFSQASPASSQQNMAYQCRSPGPPMDQGSYQPSSPLQQSASYPQLSPARANQTPYSQSPIPQNSNIYAHPQMMSPGSSQNYSTQRSSHPYSPASHMHSGYGQSPVHQPQSRLNTPYNQSPPQNMSMNAASGNSGNPTSIAQQYQSDLSSEISAAISSPGPASPGIGHIDFEPPIIDSQIQTQEAENSSSRSISQRTSPGGDQMTPNDLAQSSSNMVSETALNAMGDVSHASSHDSNDIMDTCTNTMMQMSSNHPLNSQNRHSALNLIGPSSSSNTSSPIPSAMDATKPGLDMSRTSAAFGASSAMYNNSQPGSNEAQSPVSNEQRLGFQVPTPSGSANSSYGTVTPVAADLSNVPRNSPRDIDNASVASVSSQHERSSYPLGGYPDAAGSPRQSDSGGLLAHHAASMYHSNPFTRMGSTPPQSSPFSSQSGGAFRGISGLEHGSPQQGPVDYGSPVKQSSTSTKQQDVSSKSLSGLESLVDQIPSIADGGPSTLSSEVSPHAAVASATGPTSVPTLENPYAAHAPLYNPYPYQPTPYAPPPVSNNSYSSLAASSFVGYPASPYGQLMRPTPGYLPEALSAYHPAHHSGYPGLTTQQYGPGAGYGPAGPTPNYSAYYNGYGPPSIPNTPNMPTYLTSHVLDHIHKNAAADASSVSFGGFC